MSDVTRILTTIEQGDAKAAEELLPAVYDELRRLAAQKLSREPPGQIWAKCKRAASGPFQLSASHSGKDMIANGTIACAASGNCWSCAPSNWSK